MSITKRQFHEEICAMMDDDESRRQDAEYQAWTEYRERQIEKQTNWFPDYRLAHSGYLEIVVEVQPEIIDDDLPF